MAFIVVVSAFESARTTLAFASLSFALLESRLEGLAARQGGELVMNVQEKPKSSRSTNRRVEF